MTEAKLTQHLKALYVCMDILKEVDAMPVPRSDLAILRATTAGDIAAEIITEVQSWQDTRALIAKVNL